ncbi:MAG TPA: hypothetical protein VH519_14375 [Hyphomicrobiaceae bacterium]
MTGEKDPVARPSATQELEALELARGRLEAVLASDEYWRALRQTSADDVDRAGRAARQARNTRLEMALVGNAHYQAWKHLNDAITALRARHAGQASPVQDSAQPLPREPVGARGSAPGPAAASPQRLAERLGQLEGPQIEAIALPGETAGRGLGAVAAQARRGPGVRRDAPEASVTFVVRDGQAPATQAWEAPPDSMAQHSTARLERLRSLEAPEVGGGSRAARGSDAEAEVTIISADGRRQQREAEEEAGHVRRFRRALSGD